jgi:4-azaleucine resistance transporter AzlC
MPPTSIPATSPRFERKLDLDQRQAAELFGGGVNAFSRYENGKTKPPLALVKLFKLLDRHPELLNEAAGMSAGTIALATLIVNSRHMFYGLSLLKRLPEDRLKRWYLIFALTDETYSVITTLPAGTSEHKMVLVALLNQGWWVLGTLLGAVLGVQAKIDLEGLDFALVALFCVLTIEQWRTRQSAAPLWVALCAFAIAYPLSAQHAMVIAIGLSVAAAVALQIRGQRTTGAPPHD